MSGTPVPYRTILDAIVRNAEEQSDRLAFAYSDDGGPNGSTRTFRELRDRARSVAAHILSHAKAGDRAILYFSPGLEFIEAFYGCLFAGVIAVPVPYPAFLRDKTLDRLGAIIDDCRPQLILCTARTLLDREKYVEQTPSLGPLLWLPTEPLEGASDLREMVVLAPETELAFLQYTSGSTSSPKGVMVTHDNLLHNATLLSEAGGTSRASTYAGWLPHYHDMGLLAQIAVATVSGFSSHLMSPLYFLQRPARWLRAIGRLRATHSGAPNFAYDYCVRKIKATEIDDLRLETWTCAFTGAEPILARTLRAFEEKFGPSGFSRASFQPGYGLAESTLFVTGNPLGQPFRTVSLDTHTLEKFQKVSEPRPGMPMAELVSSGIARGNEVRVMQPHTSEMLGEGIIGEIVISGRSVAAGYWERPLESTNAFGTRCEGKSWLRTGDLGFLQEGHLFITGRIKDLLIFDGRNVYPQDIELALAPLVPRVRENGIVAFGAGPEQKDLVVVVERSVEFAGTNDAAAELARESQSIIANTMDLPLRTFVILAAGALPRTSSGKVRRQPTRLAFESGELDTKHIVHL